LAQVPLWAWPLAVAGLWGSYGLRAERLRREWGTWGRTHRPEARMPSLSDSVDLFLTHNAALLLLPMRAGEAGYPWLLHRRFGIPVAESVRSLVWLRLQDALVLACWACWAWRRDRPGCGWPAWRRWCCCCGACCPACRASWDNGGHAGRPCRARWWPTGVT
jgi:hypothetical protein